MVGWLDRVIIVLPPAIECGTEEIVDGWDNHDEDIVIVDNDPVYGPVPHTVQAGGCGHRGVRITIPAQFLTDTDKTEDVLKGKLFAKEWVKYRFGVFDEFGFPDDLLYPNIFHHEGDLLPTGTTNSALMGRWISQTGVSCEPTEDSCLFLPSPSNPAITCSLGNLFFLPNVHTWCRPHQVQVPEGPTKQKVLCNGKGSMEIISNHLEYRTISSNSDHPLAISIPTFTLVRQGMPRYAIVIEATQMMEEEWKWVRKSVQYLVMFVLPEGASVLLVTYGTQHRVEHSMTVLAGVEGRLGVADSLPEKVPFLGKGSCGVCGVRGAIRGLGESGNKGGKIILITGSSNNNQKDMKEVEDLCVRSHMKLSRIHVGIEREPASSFSSGQFILIRKTASHLNLFKMLLEAIIQSIKKNHQDMFKTPEVIKVENMEGNDLNESIGTFIIDDDLGEETVFAVLVDDVEKYGIKSVKFESEDGEIYGPYYKLSSAYNLVNMKTVSWKKEGDAVFKKVCFNIWY